MKGRLLVHDKMHTLYHIIRTCTPCYCGGSAMSVSRSISWLADLSLTVALYKQNKKFNKTSWTRNPPPPPHTHCTCGCWMHMWYCFSKGMAHEYQAWTRTASWRKLIMKMSTRSTRLCRKEPVCQVRIVLVYNLCWVFVCEVVSNFANFTVEPRLCVYLSVCLSVFPLPAISQKLVKQ